MDKTARIFLKGLGAIYFIAFLSLFAQVIPLFGEQGIAPISQYASHIKAQFGYKVPSLFLLHASDSLLVSTTLLGLLASFGIVFEKKQKLSLIAAWVIYLSFVNLGAPFLSFQWDILLLEVGFLSLFLNPQNPSKWVALAFKVLLFRLMLTAGLVKIFSGDTTWRELTALNVHYFTQPLPHFLSWYAHNLPEVVHKISTAAMFFIELTLPFGLFLTKPIRRIAVAGIAGLMVIIILTGNYTFFNFLVILLCLWGIEETKIVMPRRLSSAIAIVIIVCALSFETGRFIQGYTNPLPTFQSFRIINGYGLFAVMTTKRYEIEIQGTQDGKTWKTYAFKYKPGPLNHAPQLVMPNQPRLDWQMWFASLSTINRNLWLQQLVVKLLQGNQTIPKLFAHNPFPDTAPKQIRLRFYDYTFTTPEEREQTGNWWKREDTGYYLPPVSLR